jgi:transposase
VLTFGDNRRIFLSRQTVDMRKGAVSLAAQVEHELGHDPYAGDIFVFLGRAKNRVKILAWDKSGFWLCAKRLEQGRFAVPDGYLGKSTGTTPLSPAEILMLLEGIQVHRATYHAHYHPPRVSGSDNKQLTIIQ